MNILRLFFPTLILVAFQTTVVAHAQTHKDDTENTSQSRLAKPLKKAKRVTVRPSVPNTARSQTISRATPSTSTPVSGISVSGMPSGSNAGNTQNGNTQGGNPEQCDGLDNNGNGIIDEGANASCGINAACVEGSCTLQTVTSEICGDGVDNDGDYLVDEADCLGSTSTFGSSTSNSNSTSNSSSATSSNTGGTSTPITNNICANGLNCNSVGGGIASTSANTASSSTGSGYGTAPSSQNGSPEICNDLIDNDMDGDTDMADSDCPG